MKTIVQEKFTELKKRVPDALCIHKRPLGDPATQLVVLVHGLGGSRYGRRSTWQRLPRLIYEDFPSADLGLYEYSSLFRRFSLSKSTSIEAEARVLGDQLILLADYESFILIGHSMGGLLCKSTIRYLCENHENTAKKLAGLLLLATPQLGSHLLPRWLSWLSKDARALSLHSRLAQETTEFFQSKVNPDAANLASGERFRLPVWAVVATGDRWVEALSAGITIPTKQKFLARGTHQSIVKPPSNDADSFRFIRAFLNATLLGQEKPFRRIEERAARLSDFTLIRELAAKIFSGPVSSIPLMQEWWKVNANLFWLLNRVTAAKGYRTETFVGYYCVLPLRDTAVEQLSRAQITGASIEAKHLLAPEAAAEYLYIGAVVGTDDASKGAALHYLSSCIKRLAARRSVTVLARPITDDGRRIVESHGMIPIEGSGTKELPAVYKYIFADD